MKLVLRIRMAWLSKEKKIVYFIFTHHKHIHRVHTLMNANKENCFYFNLNRLLRWGKYVVTISFNCCKMATHHLILINWCIRTTKTLCLVHPIPCPLIYLWFFSLFVCLFFFLSLQIFPKRTEDPIESIQILWEKKLIQYRNSSYFWHKLWH